MVEPVVVIPDIDSKKEDAMLRFKGAMKNGIVPTDPIAIQMNTVNRSACRRFSVGTRSVLANIIRVPANAVMPALSKNTHQSWEPMNRSNKKGINMAAAVALISAPRTNKCNLRSILRALEVKAERSNSLDGSLRVVCS